MSGRRNYRARVESTTRFWAHDTPSATMVLSNQPPPEFPMGFTPPVVVAYLADATVIGVLWALTPCSPPALSARSCFGRRSRGCQCQCVREHLFAVLAVIVASISVKDQPLHKRVVQPCAIVVGELANKLIGRFLWRDAESVLKKEAAARTQVGPLAAEEEPPVPAVGTREDLPGSHRGLNLREGSASPQKGRSALRHRRG